jgi:probable rRNA maturation factor
MPVRMVWEEKAPPGVDRREVVRRLKVIAAELGIGRGELSVLLTGDAQIRDLNREYRQIDRPTDVLAFAMREGEMGEVQPEVLGDVVVSLETTARQAARAGHDVLHELIFLLTHGLLHVLGWDHDTPAKSRRMKAETVRLVALAASPPPPARRATKATKAREPPLKPKR